MSFSHEDNSKSLSSSAFMRTPSSAGRPPLSPSRDYGLVGVGLGKDGDWPVVVGAEEGTTSASIPLSGRLEEQNESDGASKTREEDDDVWIGAAGGGHDPNDSAWVGRGERTGMPRRISGAAVGYRSQHGVTNRSVSASAADISLSFAARQRPREEVDQTRLASMRLGLEPQRIIDLEEDPTKGKGRAHLYPVVQYVPIAQTAKKSTEQRFRPLGRGQAEEMLSSRRKNSTNEGQQHEEDDSKVGGPHYEIKHSSHHTAITTTTTTSTSGDVIAHSSLVRDMGWESEMGGSEKSVVKRGGVTVGTSPLRSAGQNRNGAEYDENKEDTNKEEEGVAAIACTTSPMRMPPLVNSVHQHLFVAHETSPTDLIWGGALQTNSNTEDGRVGHEDAKSGAPSRDDGLLFDQKAEGTGGGHEFRILTWPREDALERAARNAQQRHNKRSPPRSRRMSLDDFNNDNNDNSATVTALNSSKVVAHAQQARAERKGIIATCYDNGALPFRERAASRGEADKADIDTTVDDNDNDNDVGDGGGYLAKRLAEQRHVNDTKRAKLTLLAYRELLSKVSSFMTTTKGLDTAERPFDDHTNEGAESKKGDKKVSSFVTLREILELWREAFKEERQSSSARRTLDVSRGDATTKEDKENSGSTSSEGGMYQHLDDTKRREVALRRLAIALYDYQRLFVSLVGTPTAPSSLAEEQILGATAEANNRQASGEGGDTAYSCNDPHTICPLISTHSLGVVPLCAVECERFEGLEHFLQKKQQKRLLRRPWRDAEERNLVSEDENGGEEISDRIKKGCSFTKRKRRRISSRPISEGSSDASSSESEDINADHREAHLAFGAGGSGSSKDKAQSCWAWHLVSAPSDDEDPFYHYRCDLATRSYEIEQQTETLTNGRGAVLDSENLGEDPHEFLNAVIAGSAEFVDCSSRFSQLLPLHSRTSSSIFGGGLSAPSFVPSMGVLFSNSPISTNTSGGNTGRHFTSASAPAIKSIVILGYPTDCPLTCLFESLEGDYGIACAAAYRCAGWGDGGLMIHRGDQDSDEDNTNNMYRFANAMAGAIFVWAAVWDVPPGREEEDKGGASETISFTAEKEKHLSQQKVKKGKETERLIANSAGNLAGALAAGHLRLRVPHWLGPNEAKNAPAVLSFSRESAFVDCSVCEATSINAMALAEACVSYAKDALGLERTAPPRIPLWARSIDEDCGVSSSSESSGDDPSEDDTRKRSTSISPPFLSGGSDSRHLPLRLIAYVNDCRRGILSVTRGGSDASFQSMSLSCGPSRFMAIVAAHLQIVLKALRVACLEERTQDEEMTALLGSLAVSNEAHHPTGRSSTGGGSRNKEPPVATQAMSVSSILRTVSRDVKLLAKSASRLSALTTAYYAVEADCKAKRLPQKGADTANICDGSNGTDSSDGTAMAPSLGGGTDSSDGTPSLRRGEGGHSDKKIAGAILDISLDEKQRILRDLRAAFAMAYKDGSNEKRTYKEEQGKGNAHLYKVDNEEDEDDEDALFGAFSIVFRSESLRLDFLEPLLEALETNIVV